MTRTERSTPQPRSPPSAEIHAPTPRQVDDPSAPGYPWSLRYPMDDAAGTSGSGSATSPRRTPVEPESSIPSQVESPPESTPTHEAGPNPCTDPGPQPDPTAEKHTETTTPPGCKGYVLAHDAPSASADEIAARDKFALVPCPIPPIVPPLPCPSCATNTNHETHETQTKMKNHSCAGGIYCPNHWCGGCKRLAKAVAAQKRAVQ